MSPVGAGDFVPLVEQQAKPAAMASSPATALRDQAPAVVSHIPRKERDMEHPRLVAGTGFVTAGSHARALHRANSTKAWAKFLDNNQLCPRNNSTRHVTLNEIEVTRP